MGELIKEQIGRRFTRALATYDRHAEAQQRICRRLVDMLLRTGRREWGRALEIGCGSGGFTRELHAHIRVGEWTLNDLCPGSREWVAPIFSDKEQPLFRMGDAEQLAFEGPYDLVASASALQWMRDLPAFLAKLAACLRPSGVLLFNTFAPDNLPEIRTLAGSGLLYPAAETLRAWLAPHFRLLEEREEAIRLSFGSPMEVLRHLKYTGVTATGAGTAWTRGRQEAFCRDYRALFGEEGGTVSLTYRPRYLLAVRK